VVTPSLPVTIAALAASWSVPSCFLMSLAMASPTAYNAATLSTAAPMFFAASARRHMYLPALNAASPRLPP